MASGLKFNLYRAPIDNDAHDIKRWETERLQYVASRLESLKLIDSQKSIKFEACYVLAAFTQRPLFRVIALWEIQTNGEVLCSLQVSALRDDLPPMPRFGFEFMLNEGFDRVEWFGRGPGESYIDKHHWARFGRYSSSVKDLTVGYIKPQENGSHYQTRFVGITDRRGMGLAVLGEPDFSFSAHHNTTMDFATTAHYHDMNARKETVVNIDYRQNGIGSGSCGPYLSSKYRFEEKEFAFAFRLKPYFSEDSKLDTLY